MTDLFREDFDAPCSSGLNPEPEVLDITRRRWNRFLNLESTLATMLHNVPSFGCS